MGEDNSKRKIVLLVVMGGAISILHYSTALALHHHHVLYRELYFLPIILGGFWFGLKGGLATSLAISIVYLPFVLTQWQGFSPDDLGRLLDIVLFNVIAVILGILKDREQAERDRMLQAESEAAMGRAVSSIAHDMKTPLIAIGGFALSVQRKLKEREDPGWKKLEIVVKETRRLENMVKEMLAFSRPLQLDPEPADLCGLVRECIAVVERAHPSKKVEIQVEEPPYCPKVPLDSMRMQQVFINLIANAVQASADGATVWIRIRNEGKAVVVDVTDCGCGIPPEHRETIFQPFFTTKKEGTGLGLPIAKKIVEAHQGTLAVVDNPDQGVTFRLTLPIETA